MREAEPITPMSCGTACRPEPEPEHHAELVDMLAAMNVAANRMTPPNGHRSGPPRTGSSHGARLSDRKLSLQERGSRIARQPTIETKRVSITDADVRTCFLGVGNLTGASMILTRCLFILFAGLYTAQPV